MNYLTQPALSYFFCSVAQAHFASSDQLFQLVTVSMMGPNVLAILGAPQDALLLASICSLVLPLGLLCIVTFKVRQDSVLDYVVIRVNCIPRSKFVRNKPWPVC